MTSLRNLVLRGETSARKLLEGCDLAATTPEKNKSAVGRSFNSRGGGVAAALRALAAFPVVKEVSFKVRSAGDGDNGRSEEVSASVP